MFNKQDVTKRRLFNIYEIVQSIYCDFLCILPLFITLNLIYCKVNIIECTRGCQYISVHYTVYKLYLSGKPLLKGQDPLNL